MLTTFQKIGKNTRGWLELLTSIYPTELQLNEANSLDTEAPFLDLNMSITNGIVSSNFMINWMILILK